MKKNILPASVKANVEEAYDILLHDFKRQYLDSSTNLTVSKNTLLEMVPKAIANKNLLLLDDLLNFISDEARKKLDGQESYVINEFYNLNLPDKVKEKLNRIANVENLKFSTDLRAIYGDRKSTRLNSSHSTLSRMPSSA